MKKYLLRYIPAIFLIIISIVLLVESNIWDKIKQVTIFELLINLLFALSIYLVSGLQFDFLIRDFNKKGLSWLDKISLPIVMELWGLIIPFKGGMIYSIYYLNQKYKIRVKSAFAINLFTYFVTFSLAGLINFIIFIGLGNRNYLLLGFSILLFLTPFLFILFTDIIGKNSSFIKIKFINNAINFVVRTNKELNAFYRKKRQLAVVLILTVLHMSLLSLWYYYINHIIGLNLSFPVIILLILANELLLVLKFIPGNIGVSEIMSGAVVALTGSSFETGLTIALFARSITLSITFAIGILMSYYQLKYFHVKNFKNIFLKLRRNEDKTKTI